MMMTLGMGCVEQRAERPQQWLANPQIGLESFRLEAAKRRKRQAVRVAGRLPVKRR
jgi:hypothetical protein